MPKLILLRHGQSQWNKKNLFTGWVDVPLSAEGVQESIRAGHAIAMCNVDVIYTSNLIRSQMTALLAMAQSHGKKIPYVQHKEEEAHSDWYQRVEEKDALIPLYVAWELNERMYGALQGKCKEKIEKEFGKNTMQLWRRSLQVSPPEGESLAETAKRVIPFLKTHLLSHLNQGQDVLVCAHGNSLRALIMHIENLPEEAVCTLEVATGEALIYEYSKKGFFRL
jgi:2,3-bisphosphoglycerate-dependent phosphoglycerate mutase